MPFTFLLLFGSNAVRGQNISIDTSAGARGQTIDGFGTCLSGSEGQQAWWQELYFDDLESSILRVDLTPAFKSPYSDFVYNSPWYGNNPALPGPDGNNVRTYTNAADYTRLFAGHQAGIAVLGPDISQNTNYFNFDAVKVAGTLAALGQTKAARLGDFKLVGSLWSPAPWVKVQSGNLCPNLGGSPMPVAGTPWPFIWGGNFAGGKLDTSDTPLSIFDDSAQGGSGPTSALTQFARCTAAYLRGFQQTYHVRFYAVSIQNELNFEEFYNSCTYPLSSGYIAALKAVRTELDKYPDLAPIRLMGPEDLLGGDVWGMWQYGSGSSLIHKNLQYLQNIAGDPQAAAALAFFCIHGYASDGVSAANATPTVWNWWANGWTGSPTPGVPPNVKGFTAYARKSWMTETSGEDPAWLSPTTGFPNNGAWSLALRLHQALTAGQESAWVYWQMTDGNSVGASTLTSQATLTNSPKYIAAKHFFRYIRPGAVRVAATVSGSTNLLASAFLHETNQSLTVVLLNSGSSPLSTTIALPSQPPGLSQLRVFTSSDSAYWQAATVPVAGGSITVSLPGYGVATLYGTSPATLTARLAGPDTVVLSWPRANAGFALQFASSLVPPVVWATDTNSVSLSGGLGTVIEPIVSRGRFYRLTLGY